jgi:replicative DNA helicase
MNSNSPRDHSMLTAPPQHLEAEQSVIGGLLRDNDALDRIPDLKAEHFYSNEHGAMFRELVRQIAAGQRADVITVGEALSGKFARVLPYLNEMAQTTPSAANIVRYAGLVVDRAVKRGVQRIGGEMQEWVASTEAAELIVARAANRLDALVMRDTSSEPSHMADLLVEHAEMMTKRVEKEESVLPIATGLVDLDRQLGGGLERGTLTIVAARPAMGKTALALAIGRAVGSDDGVAELLSMEMPKRQVMDRNIAAIGKIPLSWIKEPTDDTPEARACWDRLSYAYQKAQEINLFIDDQTALNMVQIRAKARQVKRKAGRLDVLIVDQLSFITGSELENRSYALGEYTRGFVALAKELDCAVVLLCQLNRKCEDRPNKRPMCSDLADSGSIEQDAATIIFIYRDEIYNPDTPDKGVAELIVGKARQGATGTVPATYIGEQTRFENYGAKWTPQDQREGAKPKSGRGFP